MTSSHESGSCGGDKSAAAVLYRSREFLMACNRAFNAFLMCLRSLYPGSNGCVVKAGKTSSEENLPVCDMFVFVSSNIRDTTSPSNSSRQRWYRLRPTKTAAAFHSSLLEVHCCLTSNSTSGSRTAGRSRSAASRASHSTVSGEALRR